MSEVLVSLFLELFTRGSPPFVLFGAATYSVHADYVMLTNLGANANDPLVLGMRTMHNAPRLPVARCTSGVQHADHVNSLPCLLSCTMHACGVEANQSDPSNQTIETINMIMIVFGSQHAPLLDEKCSEDGSQWQHHSLHKWSLNMCQQQYWAQAAHGKRTSENQYAFTRCR